MFPTRRHGCGDYRCGDYRCCDPSLPCDRLVSVDTATPLRLTRLPQGIRRAVLLICAGVAGVQAVSAQLQIGGELRLDLSAIYVAPEPPTGPVDGSAAADETGAADSADDADPADEEVTPVGFLYDAEPGWETTLVPIVSAGGETFFLQGEFSVGYGAAAARRAEPPEVAIRRLSLELYPAGFLAVAVGRFPFVFGPAEFLSPTALFSRTDLVRFLDGDVGEATVDADLLQLAAFFGPAFVRVTAAPFAPEPVLVPTDSVWFPGLPIPEQIPFGTYTRTFGGYHYTQTASPPRLADVSLAAEVGATLGPIDTGGWVFHGEHPAPPLEVRLTMSRPEGLPEPPSGTRSFYALLEPARRRVTSAGTHLTATLGGVAAYAEYSFTLGAPLVELDPAGGSMRLATAYDAATSDIQIRNVIVAANEHRGVVGANYTAGTIDLRLLAEATTRLYRGIARPDDSTDDAVDTEGTTESAEEAPISVGTPMLGRAAVGGGRLGLLDGRLAVDLLGLVDWPLDGSAASGAIYGGITFAPEPAMEVSLSMLLFVGAADSNLGRYRRIYTPRIALTARF